MQLRAATYFSLRRSTGQGMAMGMRLTPSMSLVSPRGGRNCSPRELRREPDDDFLRMLALYVEEFVETLPLLRVLDLGQYLGSFYLLRALFLNDVPQAHLHRVWQQCDAQAAWGGLLGLSLGSRRRPTPPALSRTTRSPSTRRARAPPR